MRMFEQSDYNFEQLPAASRVDCMFQAAQFLRNAADHIQDGAAVWTDELQAAQTILDACETKARAAAVRISKTAKLARI